VTIVLHFKLSFQTAGCGQLLTYLELIILNLFVVVFNNTQSRLRFK